jgi:hypothetical protein
MTVGRYRSFPSYPARSSRVPMPSCPSSMRPETERPQCASNRTLNPRLRDLPFSGVALGSWRRFKFTRAAAMQVAAPAALAPPACAPSPPIAAASPRGRPSAARFHPQCLRQPALPAPSPGSPAPLIAGSALASPTRWPRRMLQPRGHAPPAPHDTARSPALHAPSMLR